MRAKKTVCFFSALLLFSTLTCSVGASSDTTVSFRGAGVTIDLIYPQEAHPTDSIWHNVTITSSTAATLRNFTLIIRAPVNSVWQEIFNSQDTFSKPLPVSYNLTLLLPQDANGILQCVVFVNTTIIDDLSTTVYTTLVSDPTFSEIQSEYNALLADYILLNATYTALNETFNILSADYTALLSEHNQLIANYNNKVAAYESLLAQYNKLSDDYNNLDADYRSKITELGNLETSYDDLNVTRYDLQASYNTLDTIYKGLNETYTNLQTAFANLQDNLNGKQGELDINRIMMFISVIAVAVLIAFIVYLKRKQEDPYLVIRKETVSMKSDEET